MGSGGSGVSLSLGKVCARGRGGGDLVWEGSSRSS